jgi:ATP-dependent Clp protease ATP-binding subunit ClpA
MAEQGYDRWPKMGARPMARVIQEQIKRPLAEELLFGQFHPERGVGEGLDDVTFHLQRIFLGHSVPAVAEKTRADSA